MSKQNEEQIGGKQTVRREGKKFYFYVSATDIMFSAPNEGSIANQDTYSSINAICRLISKARGAGVEWQTILKQLDGANITQNSTWVREIAHVIRDAGVSE